MDGSDHQQLELKLRKLRVGITISYSILFTSGNDKLPFAHRSNPAGSERAQDDLSAHDVRNDARNSMPRNSMNPRGGRCRAQREH
jgi:hypothetical protein